MDQSSEKCSERLKNLARKYYHTKLIRGFAHELNNYMTGILGFSQLILEAYEVEEELKEELREIENSAIRSRDAIRQVSRLWRNFEAEPASIHLMTLLNEINASIKYYIDKKSIMMNVTCTAGDGFVKAAEEDLEDALHSLMLSIVLDMADNSALTIVIGKEDDRVSLSFSARGAGALFSLIGDAIRDGNDMLLDGNIYLWVFLELIRSTGGSAAAGDDGITLYLPADE